MVPRAGRGEDPVPCSSVPSTPTPIIINVPEGSNPVFLPRDPVGYLVRFRRKPVIKWDACPMILDFLRLLVMPVDITLEA